MNQVCLILVFTALMGVWDTSQGYLISNVLQRRAFRKSPLKACFDCDVVRNTQIFCNVELTGASIQAVGFDMDYTLAQVCGI